MLKKMNWLEDSVLSIRLRDNLFTLAQMRRNHVMQFFALSRASNEWTGLDLNGESSMFFAFVAESKLKALFVENLDPGQVIPSCEPIPRLMLSAAFGNAGVHGANLIELTQDFSSVGARVVKERLTIENDLDLLYRHQVVGMIGDPEKLRKRLIRYFDTGVDWDDSKTFLFKGIQPPPPYYRHFETGKEAGRKT
jgi:hypothetical protein